VTTTDFGQALEVLTEAYGEHSPRLIGDPARFVLDATTVDLGAAAVGRFTCGSEVEVALPPFPTMVLIGEVVHGGFGLSDGRWDLLHRPGDVYCVPLHKGHISHCLDMTQRLVRLEPGPLASFAAALTDTAPETFRFDAISPIGPLEARYWRLTLDYVTTHLLPYDHLMALPLARAQTVHTLSTAALVVFPNSALDAATDPGRRSAGHAAPTVVRRAMDYIDLHAGEPVALGDVAAAAHSSARALQAAFRRNRDQTPGEYLRQVRLCRAHRDLQAGDPARGDTVAAIAARWGFTNPGRFARIYRQTYGHPPSDTLRQ
jgi:AraC-like DNA-binding protein